MNTSSHSRTLIQTTIDLLCLGSVTMLISVIVFFPHKIPNAQQHLTELILARLAYWLVAQFSRRLPHGAVFATIQTVSVLGLCSFLFQSIADFQHLLVNGWMDSPLLALERSALGTEIVFSLQRVVHPWLTEWMMFAYVIYVPLIPAVAVICYRSKGVDAVQDYLLNVSLANLLCDFGFMLFPLASPLYYNPEMYTVPLHGGVFTWLGEWIRHTQHYAGGSLPSPHCAAGTIMMAMVYRYNRRIFYLTVPVFLTIYAATVYGRYHYAWDGIAGILLAVAVLRWSPSLVSGLAKASSGMRWIKSKLMALLPDSPPRQPHDEPEKSWVHDNFLTND